MLHSYTASTNALSAAVPQMIYGTGGTLNYPVNTSLLTTLCKQTCIGSYVWLCVICLVVCHMFGCVSYVWLCNHTCYCIIRIIVIKGYTREKGEV